MTAVRFKSDVSEDRAVAALDAIKRDPRVLTAELDRRVKIAPQNASFSVDKARFISPKPLTVVKAATAPRAPLAVRAFLANLPSTPRVRLTWQTSLNLNGGKLLGYRVEKSSDGKVWQLLAAKVTSRVLYTTAVQSGVKVFFRVRTLTTVGKSSAVSLPSAAVSVTPTAAPSAPQFLSSNVIFQGQTVTWVNQSLSQRGGLPVTYTVTAAPRVGDPVTCQTSANSCAPTGMSSGVPYTVKISATNALGSANSLEVNDPLYGSQWHLYSSFGIQAPLAWQQTRGDSSIVVAVLDTGITSHPDLQGRVLPGYDFISDDTAANDNQSDGAFLSWDNDPSDPGDWGGGYDSSWHGTHVAGIIAANQNNSIGVSGVAPSVKILPVRVLGAPSTGYDAGAAVSDLVAAINWAAGVTVPNTPKNMNPARVMNLSIGTDTPSGCDSATQSAFRAAWDRGVTAVTAAGNAGFPATGSYPGNCYPTINVGATGFSGDQAFYSNYGPGVDFSAPGGDDRDAANAPSGTDGLILSTWNLGTTVPGDADYSIEEGTSMASPVVAGVVALLYSVRPTLSSDDAYQILKATVRPFKAGTDCAVTAPEYAVEGGYSMCGAGIVDAGAAVLYAKTYVRK